MGYNGSQGNYSSSGSYSEVIKRKYDSLVFSPINLDLVENYYEFNPCGHQKKSFSDKALQYTQSKPSMWIFTEVNIDSSNKTLQYFTFTLYSISNDPSNPNNTRNCLKTEIVLKDVPYTVTNGRKLIVINSKDLKKYLTVFYETLWESLWSQGHTYRDYRSDFNSDYEILPDAYFELTLE